MRTLNRVAELRELSGLSLADLGARACCSGEQIRKLEMGFCNPGLRLARRLADVFGVTVDDLFPPALDDSKGKAA